MKRYIPNAKTQMSRGGASIETSLDFTEVNRAIAFMESKSGESMADAIAQRLRKQVPRTQSFISSSMPPRKRFMGRAVADSLAVDIGVTAVGEAQVRFGSEPMDDGGVTGSRGGKLALMLEFGIRPFRYPFTFKTIEPSRSFGIGDTGLGHFINAKVHPQYPKYDGIGFLARALSEVQPEIDQIIMDKLQEDFA
tara:strand:- start:366 stop:947 length:582 start_codon:yes stop_codon:yes gene_type:complete